MFPKLSYVFPCVFVSVLALELRFLYLSFAVPLLFLYVFRAFPLLFFSFSCALAVS